MSLFEFIAQNCPLEITERVRGAADYGDAKRYENMRYLSSRQGIDAPRCLISANHILGEGINAASADDILGYYLSVYFENVGSLQPKDMQIIQDKITSIGPLTGYRAALVLSYLNFLKIDMRDHFDAMIDIEYNWDGVHFEDNPSFHLLIHQGLFGQNYTKNVIKGLHSITDVNSIWFYLGSIKDTKPPKYRVIFESFYGDQRMTAPGFVNPQSLDSVVRSMLENY